MANLNLSQFTEKLFVADADHTFIWDTAASISKRVSRNSWLNSGTLTSDAPVTISQTWNAVGQTFTALKVNAAGTSDANSASGSLLADFQVNAASKVSLTKTGAIRFGDGGFEPGIARVALGTVAVSLLGFSQNHVSLGYYGGASNSPGVTVSSLGHFAWSSSSTNSESTRDTILLRDGAANTLALRNGALAQTFNVYGTYTSITDYKRLSLSCSATTGNATIGVPFNSVLAVTGGSSPSTTATITFATQAAAFPVGSSVVIAGVTPSGYNGTYVVTASTTSSVSYTVGGALAAWSSGGTATVSGSANWVLQSSGNLLAGTDSVYDIGLFSNFRPRNIYAGGIIQGTYLKSDGYSQIAYLYLNGVNIRIDAPSTGVLTLSDVNQNNFNRLQFGGTSASFPALKRVGTDLQVVVANTTAAIGVAAGDADLTFIEDRYRRKGAGTPEGVVTAPIGAVYHRTDGGAGTSFYVKESGTGNTGWVAK